MPDTPATVLVRQRTIREGGQTLNVGLEFRAQVQSVSAFDAMQRARLAVESANNTIAAVSGAAIETREDALAICTEPDTDPRELLQVFDNVPTGRPTSRPLDVALLGLFNDAMNTNQSIGVERIQRALWHLRKSAGMLDLMEGFGELWMGLESINSLLSEKHNLPQSQILRTCEKCGHPMTTPITSGLNFAVTELGGGTREDLRNARELRRRLQHGLVDLMAIAPQLDHLAPLLRRALLFGVADLIGFPPEERQRLDRVPYAVGDSHGILTLQTWLRGPLDPAGLAEAQTLPEFSLALSGPGLLRSTIQLINFEGSWGPTEVTTSFGNDPEIPATERPYKFVDNRLKEP